MQLIVELVDGPRRGEDFASRAPLVECKEGAPAGSRFGCEAGEVCESGLCVPARRSVTCQVGNPCGPGASCNCDAPLSCEEGVCRATTRVAGACDDPAVQRILGGLAETCKGDVDGCKDEDLEKFALASEDFDEVMASFPSAVTIHFPNGAPDARSRVDTWPVDPERQHYRARLGQKFIVDALQEAPHVLLIARSSEGSGPKENQLFSKRRNDTVFDLLRENIGTPDELRQLRGKIKRLRLPSTKALEIDFFSERPPDRIIAWSPEEEETLRANIADAKQLSWSARRQTRALLNQMVLLVPLPCDLPSK